MIHVIDQMVVAASSKAEHHPSFVEIMDTMSSDSFQVGHLQSFEHLYSLVRDLVARTTIHNLLDLAGSTAYLFEVGVEVVIADGTR